MNFLSKMPIATKIYIIPSIATFGFVLYLAISTLVSLNNASILENTSEVEFPALRTSSAALVNMEKVRDTLSSAVTTGDEEEYSL